MRIPFTHKKKTTESPSPKKQKQRVLTAYEQSKERQKNYINRLKERL